MDINPKYSMISTTRILSFFYTFLSSFSLSLQRANFKLCLQCLYTVPEFYPQSLCTRYVSEFPIQLKKIKFMF